MNKKLQIERSQGTATPVLAGDVLDHLGQVLAKMYAPNDQDASRSGRLATLLEKLGAALASSDDHDTEIFRRGLLEAIPMLQRFAMSLCRDPSQADDLVQDTMLRAWRSRSKFVVGTNLSAWLFTIMRNSFYSKYRKSRMEIVDSDSSSFANMAALPEQAGALDLADVKKAMTKLSPEMREALLLVAVECMSYEDAAQVMGCKIGTIKSRVWRARDQLVTLLGFNSAEIGNGSEMLGALNG